MYIQDDIVIKEESTKKTARSFVSDFAKLVKFRLTTTVVFSASIAFLIGARQQGDINWINWLILILGGFLVTASASGFNEIIEKDLDRLMKRTSDRPLPAGRMTTGQALVLCLFMGIAGTLVLSHLNFVAGFISVFSLLLYAFVYTPLKQKSPIAVFVGAFPGAFPPLIGYFAAFTQDDLALYSQTNASAILIIPLVLFGIQFLWQFPHFWSIAWVADEDYKKAGFRLLPTKKTNKTSAFILFLSCFIMIPAGLIPIYYGFGGLYFTILTLIGSLVFAWFGYVHLKKMTVSSAKAVMFTSFIYLPISQLILLFDFIPLS